MTRPARALIDLVAFRANYLHARAVHGGRVAAVLKANAYGHGAVRCAFAIADVADACAVAFMEEAVQLREAGITVPILVLEGAFAPPELELASIYDFWLVVHHEEQVRMLEDSGTSGPQIAVWLKVDSGMHRAGFDPSQVKPVLNRLMACCRVSSVTLMTHLSSADDLTSEVTLRQLCLFRAATSGLPCDRSAANSAGLLAWEHARFDWGRAGLMLYGVDPLDRKTSALRPVMTLESRVFAERMVAPGESVGYGSVFVAERPTRVGLVAIGYADGYPRSVLTGCPVAVSGQITRTLGRVSMDMMAVDLTDLVDARIGSRVELWGSQVSVSAVASAAGTIPYELLCNVKRVPFTYT